MNIPSARLTGSRWQVEALWRHRDPRLYQIATLGSLLVYGVGYLGFDLPLSHAVAILVTVLLTQLVAMRLSGRPTFDSKSALISGLLIDRLLPGTRYAWGHPAGLPVNPNGEHHETDLAVGHDAAPHPGLGSERGRLLRLLRREGGHQALQPSVPGGAGQERFMLPIRLGTVNADGAQDLYVYALTRKDRVETTNYRTVRLPSGMDLPVFVPSLRARGWRLTRSPLGG